MNRHRHRSLSVFLAFLVGFAFCVPASSDEKLTSESLVNVLRAPIKLRGSLRNSGSLRKQNQLRQLLKLRGLERLSSTEREKIASAVADLKLPSVDLEVPFEYNSDRVSSAALPVLVKLGQALSDDRLSGAKFIVSGHTDAKGSSKYNLALSRRRALSVKKILVESFDIKGERLIAIGFGEEQLKLPASPNDAGNRRVQLINVGQLAE